MQKLNPRDYDVLNVLWKTEKPMTSTDIANEQKGLTQSTVMAVLRTLLRNNLVEVTGATYSGNVLSRTYRPTEESKKVIMDVFVDDYSNIRNIISKSDVCAAILEIEQNPDQMMSEVAKFKKILVEYEKRLN